MKKDSTHLVPLSRQAVTILKQLKQMAGVKRFVFPGLNSQTANGNINSNSLLNALADIGYKGIMTGHGFRGLAHTILAENGFDKEHVKLQLAHSNEDKTDAAYNYALYLPQRIAMMLWWADYLNT
jgi:integrase